MSRTKVLLMTYGNRFHASTRIRALNHFERLQTEFDVTWLPRTGLEARVTVIDKIIFAVIKYYYYISKYYYILFTKYDIVFVQIMFLPEILLKIIKAKGASLCYDFDDAVYTYSPNAFDKMIDYADKIIISTPFLAENIPDKKSYKIVYSPVNVEKVIPTEKERNTFTIGWIGSPDGVYHFNSMKNVFLSLKERIPFKLLIMGADMKIEGIEIEYREWSEDGEIEALKSMDVGIMPLAPHVWTPKKGGYKLFLYMAAAIPVIATPTGINQIIVKEGINGFLPQNDDDWLNAFIRLFKDKNLGKQYGSNGRKMAEQFYSYDVCTPQLRDYLINSN